MFLYFVLYAECPYQSKNIIIIFYSFGSFKYYNVNHSKIEFILLTKCFVGFLLIDNCFKDVRFFYKRYYALAYTICKQ